MPVILRKEVFDKIQAELKRRKSEYCRQSDESIGLWESYEKNLFSGLFYCDDCGASMGRRNRLVQIDGKSYNTKVFYCRSHMNTSKECDGKTIKERELSEILVKAFQVQLRQVQELEQKLITMCSGSFSHKICEVKEKIHHTDRKLIQLDTERICHYTAFRRKQGGYMKKILIIYLRLSKEDKRNFDESNSISNQRQLIWKYIKEHQIDRELTVKEYVDDGYSGKNMNRPGIQEVLSAVRERKVAIIIVKDFSRMGRVFWKASTIWISSG